MEAPTNENDIHPDVVAQIKMSDVSSESMVKVGSVESPIASALQSRNYKPGVAGWKLSSNGEVDIQGITPGSAVGVSTKYILYRVLSPATSHTVSSVGGDLEIPVTGTITAIGAYVDTAGTTGTGTIDVNKNGTTIMTANKITIDTGEKSSRTAATAPALTTTSVSAGDVLTFDIDGTHTTPAKGLTIRLTIE